MSRCSWRRISWPLEELRIVERHAFRGSAARLERAAIAPQEHHDHLIDRSTGCVVEFRSGEVDRLQADIAARLGYRIVGHRLELYGEPIRHDREVADETAPPVA